MSDASLILNRRDLEFLLHEWLRVSDLTDRERFKEHSRETFDAILDVCAEVAATHFAPHNRAADLDEPFVADDGEVRILPAIAPALDHYHATGLHTADFDAHLGGLQVPSTVTWAAYAWFQGANLSSIGYPMLARGNARVIVNHGSPQLIDAFARPILEGRWYGTMCLSEPHAGSTLADITTKAVPQDDGTYRVTGTKMWISAGDHPLGENIVHLVLAKIPGGPAGVKGISLFIVPKFLVGEDGSVGERNDVALVGLNHKMGHRGITNTLLNFGDGSHLPGGRAGAVGYLVGRENAGLAAMFTMMNEARIGVGMSAVALGYTGYLHSVQYARTRLQGRSLGTRDDAGPMIPIIEHADIRRMLLAQKSYVEAGLALSLFCAHLVDEAETHPDEHAREEAVRLLDLLTPVTKAWPAQWCLAANDLAIQVHGGSGYTKDFPVEQFYRDNRLNAIHEGTNGIQSLDLLGRKVTKENGAMLGLLMSRMRRAIQRASSTADTADLGSALSDVVDRLAATTAALWSTGDREVALANSTVYLEAFGHIVAAWLWLEMALVAGDQPGDFYEGKRTTARYFFAYELPKVGPQLDLLSRNDTTALDAPESIF